MFAPIPGGRLFFDIDGPGQVDGRQRPVLFLLHGGPGGSQAAFRSHHFDFTDVAQLVYIDHRGCGQSVADDPASCTLDSNIDDLDHLRRHLGIERISLLGYSYGGMVAQGYAIRHPERVANLILLSTAPSYRFIGEARAFIADHGTADQQRVCRRLWDGTFESDEQIREYYRIMGPLYARTHDAEAFERDWKPGSTNFHALNLGFSTFLREFDWLPELPSVTCPSLVLGGQHDWITSVNQSRELARRLPRAHLKIFPNSSHAIPADETAPFQAAVRGFLTYAE